MKGRLSTQSWRPAVAWPIPLAGDDGVRCWPSGSRARLRAGRVHLALPAHSGLSRAIPAVAADLPQLSLPQASSRVSGWPATA